MAINLPIVSIQEGKDSKLKLFFELDNYLNTYNLTRALPCRAESSEYSSHGHMS